MIETVLSVKGMSKKQSVKQDGTPMRTHSLTHECKWQGTKLYLHGFIGTHSLRMKSQMHMGMKSQRPPLLVFITQI